MSDKFIPFGRPNYSDQEIKAVTRIMKSGWVGMGAETLLFEKEISHFLGAENVVTVNSCTSALFLSLLTLGIGRDDEVICPSLTWCSTANAALYLGSKIVFCDVDSTTLCVTAETIQSKITPKTKAVIVVHFGGFAIDIDRLRKSIPSHIHIIEDAAHAFGARYPNGDMVGCSNNLVCFSFYANKNLSTGEGGAVTTSNRELAQRIELLSRNALASDAWKRFSHKTNVQPIHLRELGYKMNYTDLQAGIGRVQLKRFQQLQLKRSNVAQRYVKFLTEKSVPVEFQRDVLSENHAKHLFLVKWNTDSLNICRNELLLRLKSNNIGASIHYAPLHLMPLYGQQKSHLPNTEWLSQRIMTLPMSSSLTDTNVRYILKTIENITNSKK